MSFAPHVLRKQLIEKRRPTIRNLEAVTAQQKELARRRIEIKGQLDPFEEDAATARRLRAEVKTAQVAYLSGAGPKPSEADIAACEEIEAKVAADANTRETLREAVDEIDNRKAEADEKCHQARKRLATIEERLRELQRDQKLAEGCEGLFSYVASVMAEIYALEELIPRKAILGWDAISHPGERLGECLARLSAPSPRFPHEIPKWLQGQIRAKDIPGIEAARVKVKEDFSKFIENGSED